MLITKGTLVELCLCRGTLGRVTSCKDGLVRIRWSTGRMQTQPIDSIIVVGHTKERLFAKKVDPWKNFQNLKLIKES